jgi:hypothetical protein
MDLYLTLNIKINSEWVKDLNVRHNTKKLLEEKLGKSFLTLAWNIFLYYPKCTVSKSKHRQMRLNQTKKLQQSDGNNQQSGDNPQNWRKYLQTTYRIRS